MTNLASKRRFGEVFISDETCTDFGAPEQRFRATSIP
jgi:hypothetical protein